MTGKKPIEITIPLTKLEGKRSLKFAWGDTRGGPRPSGFVALEGGEWRAYRNICPHLGTPLDWDDARFFEEEGRYLVCATHGALFKPNDGLCIAGPCSGQSLMPLPVEKRDDELVVRIAELPADENPVEGCGS